MILHDTAYAKINLALHVRRRRADGYHDLETLFAFLDVGDNIEAGRADAFEIVEAGDFAAGMGPVDDNLVTRAARVANGGSLPSLRFWIDKRLPVAAGLGGGSADAGAVLRMLGKHGAEGEALAAGFDAAAHGLTADPITAPELPAGLLPDAAGYVRTTPAMLAAAGGLDGFFVARWRRA